MGRGTGYLFMSSSCATSPALSAVSSTSLLCCIITVLKLRFSASTLGHERESRMCRTLQFDAVLRACVRERLWTDRGASRHGAVVAGLVAPGEAGVGGAKGEVDLV